MALNFRTDEIRKLIQFAYDLHEKDLAYKGEGCGYVPNFIFNGEMPYNNKRLDNGMVFGHRGYANHSDNGVYTTLGVVIGEHLENGFKYNSAIKFETSNNSNNSYYLPDAMISLLQPEFKENIMDDEYSLIFNETNHVPNLTYFNEKHFNEMSEEDQLTIFLVAMETIGFKRDDILAILSGRMTAEEAFMSVAPPEIANQRWVNTWRKHFVFNGNVAISGWFETMELDKFPFPFEGGVIIDCASPMVKTACVEFGFNRKGHKLINVNGNPKSIIYTDLRNAIIEEPIDLSIVDATCTKFGHHTVINVDKSIASLKDIELTLAVDENGNSYVVDEKGIVQLDELGKPKTKPLRNVDLMYSNSQELTTSIEVLANADNYIAVEDALNNNAAGIGLVRTEHMFFDENGKALFVELLLDKNYSNHVIDENILTKCAEIQKMKASSIFKSANGKSVIFRLLDAKLGEFLNEGIGYRYEYRYYNLDEMRGAIILLENPEIVKMQVNSIIEAAIENGATVNLLIPMITDDNQFAGIKKIIDESAKDCGFADYSVGAMIETLEMASNAHVLAREADFISFGTNDLTESATGLSRGIGVEVFNILCDEVKSVIKKGIYRARIAKPDIKIGVCGEHCSYLENIDFLQESGVDYITCNANFIPTAKLVFTNNDNSLKEKQRGFVYVLRQVRDKKQS